MENITNTALQTLLFEQCAGRNGKIIGTIENFSDLSGVIMDDEQPLPFLWKDVVAKKAELEALEPLRVLREQRNDLLSATDWQATSDRTMSNEQQIYRQQLRDLPENSTPALDEDGQLTGVTWPEVPE
jgi:hypothetical protein